MFVLKNRTFFCSSGSLYLVTDCSRHYQDGDFSIHPSANWLQVTEVPFKLKLQTFFRFLLPTSKHQPGVQSGESFSCRNLICLMSYVAIVCLGCCVFDGPPPYANPHNKRQTDVGHMCFHFHLSSVSSASLFQTTITGVACSVINSPVRSPNTHDLSGASMSYIYSRYTRKSFSTARAVP